MMRAEDAPPPLLQIPSSSMSKNVDTASGQVSKANYCEHKRQKAEILQIELPLRVNYYVYMFLKQSTKFAQLFVSESCPSHWHQFGSLKPCCVNEKESQSEVICDWRGRCILKEFFSISGISSNKLRSIGALTFVCESTIKNMQSFFTVSGAHVPFCPLIKFYTHPPYIIDRTFRQNFFAQCILSIFKKEINVSLIPS